MIKVLTIEEVNNDINLIFNKEEIKLDKGLYIAFDYDHKLWLAVDYTTNDYLIKEYRELDDAIKYLRS